MKQLDNHAAKARRQRGQTLALVAVAMVSLLAMAALAIDLTTLYVARGEIQRAADAAALAGAKAFVDSGVTTAPTNTALQTLAQSLATDFATGVVNQNHVAGAPAQFINGTPQVNLNISLPGNPSAPGNPRITVSLQRTDLPLFFAKIWGNSIASVSATAIAEAYNPAYSQANTGSFIPSAPKCVKPFLVPNLDPNQGVPFVDISSNPGAIFAAPLPFIGETLTLSSACVGNSCSNTNFPKTQGTVTEYLPMQLPDTHLYCPSGSAPSCSGSGGSFEASTKCCDGPIFDYGQCGVSGTIATWNPNINPGGNNGAAQQGLQCLIHDPQQDILNPAFANNGLMQIQPGSYSQARYNVAQGSLISTSDSIITVPLFDPKSLHQGTQTVTVVGFLQLFVKDVGKKPQPPNPGPPPDMNAYILNIIGCGNSLTAGSAVSGGGASAIPVRLIHN
jgi:hypothetical protein